MGTKTATSRPAARECGNSRDAKQGPGQLPAAELRIGQAELLARSLPRESIAVVVTSPPYWARRRYTENPAETGQGDLQQYITEIRNLFRAIKPALKENGVVWLNVGDTASGSGGSGGDYNTGGTRSGQLRYRQGRSGLAKGQWASVPHRVAHVLVDDGWLLRSTVVWDKGKRRREPLAHCLRPGESHEYLFMFTGKVRCGFDPRLLTEDGSVWHVPPAKIRTGHVATMPEELSDRMLEAVTVPGAVLDPFVGSGTTMVSAARFGRDSIGFDIDPSNEERIRERLDGIGSLSVKRRGSR